MWNKNLSVLALALSLVALGLAGCTGKSEKTGDPVQGVLKEYISRSFAAKGISDREPMLAFLTGEAKTRLAAWSDEQFLQAFVDYKREFVKLLIIDDKKISPQEERITYELTYLDHGREKSDKNASGALVTNRKLCHLVNQNGKWLITEMRNIKELVEYRNEMTFPF
jgi:hypothetical protein